MADTTTTKPWILGPNFAKVYPHHSSISALWTLEWKPACQRSTYPFHEGKLEDFEPIFTRLIEKGIHDGYSDGLCQEFTPTARELSAKADAALAEGDTAKAKELYLRSCAVYRIARFSYISGSVKREAHEAQKATYMKASAFFDLPVRDVGVPHTPANPDEGSSIPTYVCTPSSATASDPCPAVILMCGLDGYRPDFTNLLKELSVHRGWACILVDIPGITDCPADPRDPAARERLWSSMLDWMRKEGYFDMQKVVCWGLSAGGYYAARAAHTHTEHFAGAIAQGVGTHYFFDRDWLVKGQWHEYPWTFLPAATQKFGYGSTEEFLDNAQKDFSLLNSGIVDTPSCRLLLVNGTQDGLMPIEDSMLMLEHGSPKEARFFPGLTHMGNPHALPVVYTWIESIVGVWKRGQGWK